MGPVTFASVYCVAYVAALAFHWPLFVYYPLVSEFSWGRGSIPDSGPAMAWYGIMATAALVALPLSVVVADGWITARLRGKLWLIPLVAMLACVYLMKAFFL